MSTISQAIIKDHRELEEHYSEVINNSDDHDHQQRYGNQFTWELARHCVGEELVVYPAMEKYLGARGKETAEEDRRDHHEVSSSQCRISNKTGYVTVQQIKVLLKHFQGLKASDPTYVEKLKEIWGRLSEHMKKEEERDLPALEEKLEMKQGESQSMSKSFGRTKAFVPSRSHPAAGEHPPFETVMSLLTAPIDHVADLFRKFPESPVSPNTPTK